MVGVTLLLASFLGIQQATPESVPIATLTVNVVDRAGRPLQDVVVSLENPAQSQAPKYGTGPSGSFQVKVYFPTEWVMKFERAGYVTYTRPRVRIVAGQTLSLTVALEAVTSDDATAVRSPDPTFPLAPGEIAVGIETSLGTFYIAVDPKRAPITTTNFLRYVDAKLYDWGRFHRATRPDNYTAAPPNRPMMNIIQGGIDPAKRNEGFPAIPLERTTLTGIKHVVGVVSMARGAPDSATSDFFVLLDDQPSLDYGGLRFDDGQGGGAFGHVLSGLDIVKKIQQQPVDGQNLSGPVTIRRVWRLSSQSQEAHATTLALNRALGVECTHCHVQAQWTDASKPAFETARNMLRMVDALNKRLGDLGPIACVTCHGGQTRPSRQPRPQLDEQLARWPAALADAAESLRITMAVYNVALGVGCDHCHSSDWKAKDKAAIKKLPLMSSLFEEFPKYMPTTARTQCYMCHKGSTRPTKSQ